MSDSPSPLTIAVSDEALDDLKQRIKRARWPDQLDDAGWDYGTNRDYLQDLCAYWASGFDWREQERRLNAFAQYRASIDGFNLHYVYQPGNGPAPVPLLLSHTCFSNFTEFRHVISELSDPAAHGGNPEDAFDVVVWSLPGFGYSDQPKQRGCNIGSFAEFAHRLMCDVLGYDRYAAAGGSWGGLTTSRLAYERPEDLIGIYLTQAMPYASFTQAPEQPLSDAELAFQERSKSWGTEETGYYQIQSTRPQSLAYGLMDSPVGLAGWVVEKLRRWSDCGGNLETAISRDDVLTNLSVYWFTQTINSAQRIYYEYHHEHWAPEPGRRIEVPTGVLGLPGGIPSEAAPPDTVRRLYNLEHYRMSPKGGHFPALEIPEIVVAELRTFFRRFR